MDRFKNRMIYYTTNSAPFQPAGKNPPAAAAAEGFSSFFGVGSPTMGFRGALTSG
jgi:hypothetical protein